MLREMWGKAVGVVQLYLVVCRCMRSYLIGRGMTLYGIAGGCQERQAVHGLVETYGDALGRVGVCADHTGFLPVGMLSLC